MLTNNEPHPIHGCRRYIGKELWKQAIEMVMNRPELLDDEVVQGRKLIEEGLKHVGYTLYEFPDDFGVVSQHNENI